MNRPTIKLQSAPKTSLEDPHRHIEYALVEDRDKRPYWTTGTVAYCRAQMLAHAADYRRLAEEAAAKAAAYEAGAAEAATWAPHGDLIRDTRDQVLGRLRWCESFFGRKHLRKDTWPEDRRDEFNRVRAIVSGCDDIEPLVRWSVICERMATGWVDALAEDVLAWPAFGPGC